MAGDGRLRSWRAGRWNGAKLAQLWQDGYKPPDAARCYVPVQRPAIRWLRGRPARAGPSPFLRAVASSPTSSRFGALDAATRRKSVAVGAVAEVREAGFTTSVTPTEEWFGYLRSATAARGEAKQAASVADQRWRTMIRHSLAAGFRVEEIARAAGITTRRVYQIRDGGR